MKVVLPITDDHTQAYISTRVLTGDLPYSDICSNIQGFCLKQHVWQLGGCHMTVGQR